MEALGTIVAEFVRQNVGKLPENYVWEIPSKVPVEFSRGTDSCFEANIRLRACLANSWSNNADFDHRFRLAKWYVADWGGVIANARKTLERYVKQDSEQLSALGKNGIASWSKILVLHDPQRFTIFDARVAACLNAIIIKHDIIQDLFPSLTSRNKTVDGFNKALKIHHGSRKVVSGKSAYTDWLAVATFAAAQLGYEREIIEMTLFAMALDTIESLDF